MYKIVEVKRLNQTVFEYEILAPKVTLNAKPGQFIILRVDEDGERVPFTICDINKDKGSIKILVQVVGFTTALLSKRQKGDFISDFVGPLGHATDISGYDNVIMVGGGIGAAVIYPQAKLLTSIGKPAEIILGARTKDLIIYQNEFLENSKMLHFATDDGSLGTKGFVTDVLARLINTKPCSLVFAVGPMPMMRAVCNLTKQKNIHTIVSMNANMVDGTGMCGCCRVTVDGQTKYACVDGPEFDGHLIDWQEAINRLTNFKEIESAHSCRIRGQL